MDAPDVLKLPDGRTVEAASASDDEIALAADRLEQKAQAHAAEASRLRRLRQPRWLTPGVAGIGGASFLADVGTRFRRRCFRAS
jgi:hypothetical protein